MGDVITQSAGQGWTASFGCCWGPGLLLHACFCHWTAMSGLCLSRCHRLSSYVGVSLEPSPPRPAFLCPPLWSQPGSTLVRSPSSLWVLQPPAPLRIVTGPYLLICCSLCLACSNLSLCSVPVWFRDPGSREVQGSSLWRRTFSDSLAPVLSLVSGLHPLSPAYSVFCVTYFSFSLEALSLSGV